MSKSCTARLDVELDLVAPFTAMSCRIEIHRAWRGWCWGSHPDRCYELPACTSAGSLWLPHTKFNSRGTFNAISSCHFFIQGHSPLSHSFNSLPGEGRLESLAPHHFPKTTSRTDFSFPWLLPKSLSHSIAGLCTVVSTVNSSPFLRQFR